MLNSVLFSSVSHFLQRKEKKYDLHLFLCELHVSHIIYFKYAADKTFIK